MILVVIVELGKLIKGLWILCDKRSLPKDVLLILEAGLCAELRDLGKELVFGEANQGVDNPGLGEPDGITAKGSGHDVLGVDIALVVIKGVHSRALELLDGFFKGSRVGRHDEATLVKSDEKGSSRGIRSRHEVAAML